MTTTELAADETTQPDLVSADSLWRPPAGGFFEGRWQDGRRRLAVFDPEDGSQVGEVLVAPTRMRSTGLCGISPIGIRGCPGRSGSGGRALESASDQLRDASELFTVLIATEGCKTVTEARQEVARAVEVLRLCAQLSATLTGKTVPFDDTPRGAGWRGWYTRSQPVGLVAAITPLNDSLNLVVHKLGPALVAGKSAAVLKPAPATPLTALAFAQILLAAGVPPDLLAILPGIDAGRALVAHPLVDLVSFTGGTRTADKIAHTGPARKLLMELGGNNAVLVCPDADLDEVAAAVVDGAFGVAGQNCLSVQRVLAHRSLFAGLVEQVSERAGALVVGSKQDPATDIGPLVSSAEAARVVSWVEEAVAAGATVHVGGTRTGSFVNPAVLTGVPHSARLWSEEVFGPVVAIEPYDDLDTAVAVVNGVDTGLQARSVHPGYRPGPRRRRSFTGGRGTGELDLGLSDRRHAVRRVPSVRDVGLRRRSRARFSP